MNFCACISQCLYGPLSLRLRFSVFAWTLVLALVFQCSHELLFLCFSGFVWSLVLALASENQALRSKIFHLHGAKRI